MLSPIGSASPVQSCVGEPQQRQCEMDGDSAESHQTTSHQRYVRYLDAATARPHIKQQKLCVAAREGQRLLDMGCGTGDDVRALAKVFSDNNVGYKTTMLITSGEFTTSAAVH
jgi:hypothetical protein